MGDICIFGWVPPVKYKKARTTRTIDYIINQYNDMIKRLGMPYCESPVYPDQKEISMRCGILPHFIIGFAIENKFYVNPAIFSSMSKIMSGTTFGEIRKQVNKVIFEGLDVEQTNFEEFCQQTNYKRYYTFDGEQYEMHSLY